MKSPNYSESKVYSSIGGGPNSSLSTNLPTHSTFNSSSQMNQNMNGGGGLTKMGYTPESHMSKPRNINSNEIRQRTMDGPAISSQFSKSNGMMAGGTGTGGPSTMIMGGNDTNQDFQYDFIQQNPASFLIYSFLIRLPCLFLLQLLMKYGSLEKLQTISLLHLWTPHNLWHEICLSE